VRRRVDRRKGAPDPPPGLLRFRPEEWGGADPGGTFGAAHHRWTQARRDWVAEHRLPLPSTLDRLREELAERRRVRAERGRDGGGIGS
jgi:hypothetical protein